MRASKREKRGSRRLHRAGRPLWGRIEFVCRRHNARMDDSGYPLAQADRAFAFDGAYRTRDALSAASRAAYGMHDRTQRAAPSFCEALREATHGAGRDKPSAPFRASSILSSSRRRDESGPVLPRIAPRDADPVSESARVTHRPRSPGCRPASFYYIFTSCAGVIVRAFVRHGRAFSGGVRTCPISKL